MSSSSLRRYGAERRAGEGDKRQQATNEGEEVRVTGKQSTRVVKKPRNFIKILPVLSALSKCSRGRLGVKKELINNDYQRMLLVPAIANPPRCDFRSWKKKKEGIHKWLLSRKVPGNVVGTPLTAEDMSII